MNGVDLKRRVTMSISIFTPIFGKMNKAENKSCERCGNGFECGAAIGSCWCFQQEIQIEAMNSMRNKYSDCLCSGCLAEISRSVEENRLGRRKPD